MIHPCSKKEKVYNKYDGEIIIICYKNYKKERENYYEKEQIIRSSYGSMSDRSKPCRMWLILEF